MIDFDRLDTPCLLTSLSNLTECFSSVSMQDSAQKLPSFRCFLPVELDDRASWHETRHRKRKIVYFCHFKKFLFWRPCWNVAACHSTVERWQKKRHRWLSTFSIPGSLWGNVSSLSAVKEKQIGSRIVIILEATNITEMLLIQSWNAGKDAWIGNMVYWR